jgi:hypothetical protein
MIDRDSLPIYERIIEGNQAKPKFPERGGWVAMEACLRVYRGELPTTKIYSITTPTSVDLLPKIKRMLLGGRKLHEEGLPCPADLDDGLPRSILQQCLQGHPHRGFTVFWNRCPGAYSTYDGWIVNGAGGSVETLAFLRSASTAETHYRKACLLAAIWSDNNDDHAPTYVRVFVPTHEHSERGPAWKSVRRLRVNSGILRQTSVSSPLPMFVAPTKRPLTASLGVDLGTRRNILASGRRSIQVDCG